MKPLHALGIFCMLLLFLAGAGCTGQNPPAPAQTVITTAQPAPAPATPVPTPTTWPGAASLGMGMPFGIGGRSGTATVYRVLLLPNFTYTTASFNSPAEQGEAGEALGTQYGYNTEVPAPGNAALFVYVRLTDTGSSGIVAPSPRQFIVNYDGKDYAYRSLDGPDVVVLSTSGKQYDYLIGPGGEAGYLQPGASNAVDGFLIYEVPATIDLSRAAMVITLDAEHRPAWRLG